MTGNAPPIERASSTDLSIRALAARSSLPQQFGAVLVLAAGADPQRLASLIARRLPAVPRLRQRLVPVPPGCGRPVWLDDPSFDPARHITTVRCPAPGTDQALVDLAATLVSRPLPRSRPLWSATFVPGLRGGRLGLVIVLDHVLADGLGGLAVLAGLVDGGAAPAASPSFPRRRPGRRRLAADAIRSKVRAVRRLPRAWQDLRSVLAAGGGLRPPRAAPSSLLGSTGGTVHMAVARADVARLREAAHRHGGSVNDAVLAALSGAVATLLRRRGESVDPLVVTVMVTARRASGPELGNAAAPLLVRVPTDGDAQDRLRRIAGMVRAARESATAPPAVGLLGPVFRLLAFLGAYRWWLSHQRRFHVLLSNVRGPDDALALGGALIEDVLPVSVGEAGNVTVSFVALSYAGRLTVTVVADAARVPELPLLAAALQGEFDTLTRELGAHIPAPGA